MDITRLLARLEDSGSLRFSPAAEHSFYEFLKEGQFVVDKDLVDPDKFYWLDPLYSVTRDVVLANGYSDGIVLYKPAQMGATTAIFLFILWICIGRDPLGIALFFPSTKGLETQVKTRFNPLLNHPKIRAYLDDGGVDTLAEKKIGSCTVYFRGTEGVATVDSIPVNIAIYDEVRRISPLALEQSDYRLAQQEIQMRVYASVAEVPGDQMDRLYQRSNQLKFHSRCANCHCTTDGYPGLILGDMDPPQFIRTRDDGTAEFFCKHTSLPIEPRNGEYKPHNSEKGKGIGIRFPAFLAPITTAAKVMDRFENNLNRREFWVATMGRAALDAEGTLVSQANVDNARAIGKIRQHVWEKTANEPIYVGIDCRTEELHFVAGTESRLVHLEVIQGANSYERAEDLLNELAYSFGIIDYLPHTSLTLPFARRNHRISPALYRSSARGEMVRWNDEQKGNLREEVRTTRMVLIDQTLSLKYALNEFAQGRVAMPDAPLHQEGFYDRKRNYHPQYDVAQEFIEHIKGLKLVHEPVRAKIGATGETVTISGQFEEKIADVSFDPHFAHAYNYYRMAVRLESGGLQIASLRKRNDPNEERPVFGNERRSFAKVCGNCRHFDDSRHYCQALHWNSVNADDPACKYPGAFKRRTS